MFPLASNEADRLAALRALGIVDTPEEAHFEAVCRLARDVFAVPIALISFIEEDRQWFKAKCGLSVDGTSRDVAFCTYAILADDVMVVEDATTDPRFADNPLVQGECGVRFYAGAPLVLRSGIHVGTLCIKDTVPRSLSGEQIRQLRDLAEIIVAHLRLHEANNRLKREILAREEHQNFILSQAQELGRREAALRETNRLLLMAEQMAHAGHWRLELPDQHRGWSDEVYRIFGLDPQSDMPGLTDAINGYHADDQKRVRHTLANAAVMKTDFCFEARVVRPSGELRDVVVRGTYDAAGENKQGALMGVIIDITELNHAQARLRETEQRFRLAVEGMADYAIIMLDPKGCVASWNVGAQRIIGYTADEIIGQHFSRFYTAEEQAACVPEQALQTAIDTSRFEAESWRVCKSGRSFWANVVIEPIRDNAGLLIGFSKVTRDNTERRAAETKLLASEARYRALADALPQIVWVMRAEDGEATYVNRQFEAYYGPIGTSAAARLVRNHPSDAERMESAWHAVREGQAVDFEGRLLRHDGVYRWHKLVIVPVRRGSDIVEWFGTALDIDDIVTARNKLEETTDLLRLAQEAAGAGVWELELGPGIVRLSPQSAAMHGVERAPNLSQDVQIEMTVKDWEAYVHPDDLVQVFAEATRAIEQRNIFSAEFRVAYPGSEADGYRWLQSFGRILFDPDSNEPIRVVGLDLDITERKKAEQQIAHMAVHDALTGLPNRVLFRDRLEREIASSERNGSAFAVLACDLDAFKVVNDTLGHPAGDILLGIVAERLGSVVRHGDIVARLGGDEFAIILSNLDHPQEAGVIAQRVIEAVRQAIDLDGRPTNVGISIGIAAGPVDGTNANDLFKHADLALYRAKIAGRNTYRFYEAEMDAAIAARNLLQLDMCEALKHRGFVLHYQPVINLSSNVTGGFEALLRWQHPVRGVISPAEFIPLAEETGLIVSLGDWALREACRDAASWPDHLRVAVNVSAVQFQQPGLEQSVLRALAASGLRANRLELEITESVLLADAEAVIASLHRLRALGIRIALDDFGTGFSSLSYLRRFPFDKIKIDRSFIHEIADPDTAAIVRAVVGLGARLGTAITAEGVESNEQLELARQEGCTEAQGFLFSRPLPAVEALKFACSGHSRAAA